MGAIWLWVETAMGPVDYARMMCLLIPAVTVHALGIQIIMPSFLSGVLDLKVTK
jgi:hypothetical protein